MFLNESFLEKAWDDLLSHDATKIRNRFCSLDIDSQKTVIEHLQKMATESGWHPEQVISAQIALQSLKDQNK